MANTIVPKPTKITDLGLDTAVDLLGDDKLGQYWNSTLGKYDAGWRTGDADTRTYVSKIMELHSGVKKDNYRYLRSASFADFPKDENWVNPSIYQSSTAGDTVEVQVVGEIVDLYVIPDASYGTGNIYINDSLIGVYDWGTAASETVIADCEAAEGWGAGSTSDAVNVKEGAASRRVTLAGADSSLTSELTLGAPLDLSTMDDEDHLKTWIYVEDATNAKKAEVILTSDAGAGVYTNYAAVQVLDNLEDGWNEISVRLDLMIEGGTMDWSDVRKVRIKAESNAVGGVYISFDDIRFVQVKKLYGATGLATNPTGAGHSIKIEVISGIINIAHLSMTATKEAIEAHAGNICEIAPTHAIIGVMNGSSSDITKAHGLMDYFDTSIQLGDRTAINRSSWGDTGVGGMTSAGYFGAGSSSNIDPNGYATTTSSGFNGVAMGLTYLVLDKSGEASTAQLARWKQMIIDLVDYADGRSYTQETYYNTGNANLMWASFFHLAFQVTGDEAYRGYAMNASGAFLQTTESDPFIHFFQNKYEDVEDPAVAVEDIRAYFEESEVTTTLNGGITATATTLTLTSTTALGLTTGSTNAIINIGNEMILLTSNVAGEQWNITRGYLGSTATTHATAATVRRGFDLGYTRVQAPAHYLYGVLSGNAHHKKLAKIIWNSAVDRITDDSLVFDISGGSRNLTVTEGYWTNGFGFNTMERQQGADYPDTDSMTARLAWLAAAVDTYGFIPADTVASVASNTKQSFTYGSFAIGWANCLDYLGY